ncbi:MAG: hypothetical protein V4726_01330 [Verrucomicrobiota bacterium]
MPNSGILIPFYAWIILELLVCGLLGRLLLGRAFGPRHKTAPWLMAPAAGYAWLGVNALWMARCGLPTVKWAWLPALLLAGWLGGGVTRNGLAEAVRPASWLPALKRLRRCLAAHPAFMLTLVCCLAVTVVFPHWSVIHSGGDDFHHSLMVRLIGEAGTLPPVGLEQPFLRYPYHFSWHLAGATLGRLCGADGPMAAAVAARLSGLLLVLALGGFVQVMGRSRFSAGAAMVLAVLIFTHPLELALVGRWPFSAALAGMLVLAGMLIHRVLRPGIPDRERHAPRRTLLVFPLLFAAVACLHARQAVWCGMFLGLMPVLAAVFPGPHRRWPEQGIRRVFALNGTVLPWVMALAGGSLVFILLNIPILKEYGSGSGGGEFDPGRVPLTFGQVLAGGCPAESGLILPALAVLACFFPGKGLIRRRLLLFLTAWWVGLALIFKGNPARLESSFFLPENALMQNFLWMAVALALGADAVRRRWWFRGQSRARLVADTVAVLAVLFLLRPCKYTPEELSRNYFPVATADDVRCLRRLGKSLKKTEPGMMAVPAASADLAEGQPMASGAGGWALLYLPTGWTMNATTFYGALLLSPGEKESMQRVSALILNPPVPGADSGPWLAELKARKVSALFLGEIEAMKLFETDLPRAAAALKRIPDVSGLKVREKAGDARVYDLP